MKPEFEEYLGLKYLEFRLHSILTKLRVGNKLNNYLSKLTVDTI